MKLVEATRELLKDISIFMTNCNKELSKHCAFLGTDEEEILEYLEEIIEDNDHAVLCMFSEQGIHAAIAADICEDNKSIEILGPFVADDILARDNKEWFNEMIVQIRKLAPDFYLSFFVSNENKEIIQLLKENHAMKEAEHCVMELFLNKEYVDCHTCRMVEETTALEIRKQIEDLHNNLFGGAYYNGATLLKLVDEEHFIQYFMEDSVVTSYAFYNKEAGEGYIDFLGTDINYRKKGHASRLVGQVSTHLIQECCRKVRLCVSADNGPAIKLYEKNRFAVKALNSSYKMK